MMTLPCTSWALSSLASLSRLVMPSYSSPWLPPVRSAVGPMPFFTTLMGIMMQPQADWSWEYGSFIKPCCTPSRSKSTVAVRSAVGPMPFFTTLMGIMMQPQADWSWEYGSFIKPCCTPSRSKSTVALRVVARTSATLVRVFACSSASAEIFMVALLISGLHKQLSREVAEGFHPALGDQDAFGSLQPPVVQPQARHEVEGHARLQHRGIALAQTHGALAPIRRITKSDRVAAAD